MWCNLGILLQTAGLLDMRSVFSTGANFMPIKTCVFPVLKHPISAASRPKSGFVRQSGQRLQRP